MDIPVVRTRAADAIVTPIDQECVEQALKILTSHGATFEQLDAFLYEAWDAKGKKRVKLSCNHRIHFPEGSVRHDGAVLATSSTFEIHFPDGFILYGIEQRHMIGGDRTLIYMPTK